MDTLKALLAGIKWPAVKLSDLTSMTIQELALIAVAVALLISSLALVRVLAWVVLGLVLVTLIYRFIKEKLLTDPEAPKAPSQSTQ
jgi:fatty acid desaturase